MANEASGSREALAVNATFEHFDKLTCSDGQE